MTEEHSSQNHENIEPPVAKSLQYAADDANPEIENASNDEDTVGCFDFRIRTRSFDLHQLNRKSKRKKFGSLFRASSDTSVKTHQKESPQGSCEIRKRRFVRVVRDSNDEDYENPHVVYKYSQGFVEAKYMKQYSFNDDVLPYKVSGHTILKKHSIDESEPSSGCSKHAVFCENVEVIEFDNKSKIRTDHCVMHVTKLHDDEEIGGLLSVEGIGGVLECTCSNLRKTQDSTGCENDAMDFMDENEMDTAEVWNNSFTSECFLPTNTDTASTETNCTLGNKVSDSQNSATRGSPTTVAAECNDDQSHLVEMISELCVDQRSAVTHS